MTRVTSQSAVTERQVSDTRRYIGEYHCQNVNRRGYGRDLPDTFEILLQTIGRMPCED